MMTCPHCGRDLAVDRVGEHPTTELLRGHRYDVLTGRCPHPRCGRVVVGLAAVALEASNELTLVTPARVLAQRRRRRARSVVAGALAAAFALGCAAAPFAVVDCVASPTSCAALGPAATTVAGVLVIEAAVVTVAVAMLLSTAFRARAAVLDDGALVRGTLGGLRLVAVRYGYR